MLEEQTFGEKDQNYKPNKVYEVLDSLEISYKVHEHPAIFTCKDADLVDRDLVGGKSKNLFLRNKNKSKYYLFCLETTTRADIKALKTFLGESKLSFGSPEDMEGILDLTPGSVSIFGLINDREKMKIDKVIIDKNLVSKGRVNFHPNLNTATIELSVEDLKKFLEYSGHEVVYWDLAS